VDSNGEVERAALIWVVPDGLPVGDDSAGRPQHPGVAIQVGCRQVPDPGQLLPDRFGRKPERPVGRLEQHDDVVQI
jgi:hypothetical protein